MTMNKAALKDVGMFLATYNICHPKRVGEDLFHLQLAVSTPNKQIGGTGIISNGSINPNFEIPTNLNGRFSVMTIMPNTTHIQIVATGYPDFSYPVYGGNKPVQTPNVELVMVLNEDWKTGTANYRYLNSAGQWQEMEDIPVNIIESKTLTT